MIVKNMFFVREKKFYIFSVTVILFAIYVWQVMPPFSFPSQSVVVVEQGVGLYALAEKLREDRVIRSPFWFRAVAILLGGERDMKAGEYYMSGPQNLFVVVWRVFHGNYDVETVRLTIPEGFNVNEISAFFDEGFLFFDHDSFKALAREGYLFPDTYFVPVTATAASTILLLNDNFNRKILLILPEIEASGKTLDEIITMASIIEGEAKLLEDRKIVSGILWKRISLGIALQVDATFSYINGKASKDLTLDDLKIDSPFNTYLYRGLPPTPIANPGLESIEAALHPTETRYLYFLTGDDGTMHYSRNFNEHVEKKFKYIER